MCNWNARLKVFGKDEWGWLIAFRLNYWVVHAIKAKDSRNIIVFFLNGCLIHSNMERFSMFPSKSVESDFKRFHFILKDVKKVLFRDLSCKEKIWPKNDNDLLH